MAHDDDVPLAAALPGVGNGRSDPPGQVREALRTERKPVRMGPVGLELAREQGREIVPRCSRPPPTKGPFRQPVVGLDLKAVRPGDDLRRLHRAFERGRDDQLHPSRRQPDGCRRRLTLPELAQAVSGKRGVNDVVRVVHLAVPDEMCGRWGGIGRHEPSVRSVNRTER